MLIFYHAPNRKTVSATPGDTEWHQLSLPSDLPPKSGRVGVSVAVCTLAAAGGAGSVALVDFDLSAAPTVGFPVMGTDVFTLNDNIWYMCTTGTDTIYFLFAW